MYIWLYTYICIELYRLIYKFIYVHIWPYFMGEIFSLREANMAMEDTLFIISGDFPSETSMCMGLLSQPCLITRGYQWQ